MMKISIALISLLLFVFFGVLWYYRTVGVSSQSPPGGKTEKY